VHILPWYGDVVVVDLAKKDSLPQVVDRLNDVVAEIEPCDPWVKATFGVEGTCEGIVYYPVYDGTHSSDLTRKRFSDLSFKAKGDKHKVVKTKKTVRIDPEVAAGVEDFVKMFVTEPRLEQGLAAVGYLDMRNVGQFIGWVCKDVEKESKDELAASGLEWKQVQRNVTQAARQWYVDKVKNLETVNS
jgi:hypothetical protein